MNSNTKLTASTLSFIGMPGAGKSTLGKLVAEQLDIRFIDTDDLIAAKVGCSLQAYLTEYGYIALREVEESVLLETDFNDAVVSTGGSAVYSANAMHRLAKLGPCIYLRATIESILQRVSNYGERGIAADKSTTLEQLYLERTSLYEKYAQLTFDTDSVKASTAGDLVSGIIEGIDLFGYDSAQ